MHRILAILLGVILLGVTLAMIASGLTPRPWANHDVIMYVYGGIKLFSGTKLYLEWMESNPPAIHALAWFVAFFSNMTRLPAVLLYHLSVLAIGFSGLCVLVSRMRRAGSGINTVLATAIAYAILLIHPNFKDATDFGQREQIFTLLFIPYFVVRVLFTGKPSATLPILYLVILGHFSMMKPNFLAGIGLIELFRAISAKSLDRKTYLWIAAGVAFSFAAVAIHSWDSFIGIFTVCIPASRQYAGSIISPREFFISIKHWLLVLTSLAVAANTIFALKKNKLPKPTGILIFVFLGFNYLAILLQGKYFPYHYIPGFGFNLVIGFYLLSLCAEQKRATRALLATFALILALSAVSITRTLQTSGTRTYPYESIFTKAKKVLFIAMANYHFYEAYDLGLDVVGPWGTGNFTLAKPLQMPESNKKRQALADYRNILNQRLEAEKPGLIAVAPVRYSIPAEMSLEDVIYREIRLIPHPDYERISSQELISCCGGDYGWMFFRRKVTHLLPHN